MSAKDDTVDNSPFYPTVGLRVEFVNPSYILSRGASESSHSYGNRLLSD